MSEFSAKSPSTTKMIGDLTQEGTTTPSNFNFSIDPDAAFKPMLTSYSTRPMNDCGKADDNLED